MPSRRERKLTTLIVEALTTLRHLGGMVGQSHARSVSKSASKSVSTSGSKSTSMERGAVRFRFLDGLRGWAAVVVLLHHLFVDGLPANSFMADRALWAKVFFLNGALAVSVFFVISGFSLSIRYLETGDARALARIASGRYLRLALPIFAICAVTYALLVSGLIPPAAQRPSPLDQFLSFSPTIDGLLGFSLLKVFVAYSGAESFDPPLWTMTYEFFGSFMVFALIAYLRPSRLRTLLLAVLFLLLTALQTYFALFVAGILIADLFALIGTSTAANRAGAALCGAGLLLIALPHTWFAAVYLGGAVCLTAGVVFCAPVRRFFENRLSSFLGWISFPLYLVQAAAIYVLAPRGLDLLASYGFAPETQRWLLDFALIPIAFLCAIAFCPVNDFAVAASRRFGASVVAFGDELGGRWARSEPGRAGI
jgi:peptidoglycan/LPS O-acetylase OafA/YrhL